MPRLPVLQPGGTDFPEWRAYLRWVYGDDFPTVVDLNTFSWFYWHSPLANFEPQQVLYQSLILMQQPVAWVTLNPMVPEHRFAPYGFFVTQPFSAAQVETKLTSGRLEVLRAQFPESGVSWFYHTVGSGVFLNLDALPRKGRFLAFDGLPPDWQTSLYDTAAAEWMAQHDCSLLVIAKRFLDARVEVVVRTDAQTSADVTCPFAASVLSTGAGSRLPCECSEGLVQLLNCRREVWADLLTRSWVVSPLLSLLGLCLIGLMLLLSFVAILLQGL